VLGLVAHLVPPIVASAVLTRRTADLKRLRDTRAGRHVRSEMTPPIVALRVIGDVLTVVGPWRHRPAAIAAGALLVLARIHRWPGLIRLSGDANRCPSELGRWGC